MGIVDRIVGEGFQTIILASIFMAVTVASMVILRAWQGSSKMNRRLTLGSPRAAPGHGKAEFVDTPATPGDPVSNYYAAFRAVHGNDTRRRLLKAGYAHPAAYARYQNIRILLGGAFFALLTLVLLLAKGAGDPAQILALALPLGGFGFLLPSFVLDKIVKTRQKRFEKTFPDIVDMLVVCLEAGLTFEAAINRIAEDVDQTDKLLSIHLQIVMLELRAGRTTREALSSFAERIDVNDARSLISFVRQSEELGVSIGQSLRVFSAELRQKRAQLAEEKANTLPTKMLLPIAMFLFPVTLAIVLAPVLVSLMEFFRNGM